MSEMTNEQLETLTDAMCEKHGHTFVSADGREEPRSERDRRIVQGVIVDTWLTLGGSVTFDQWGDVTAGGK